MIGVGNLASKFAARFGICTINRSIDVPSISVLRELEMESLSETASLQRSVMPQHQIPVHPISLIFFGHSLQRSLNPGVA